MPTDGLLVDRKEFLNALNNIRRTSKAKRGTKAYISYGLGQLKIQIGTEMRTSLLAKGAWLQPIAVNAIMLGRASLDLPKMDPILLQVVSDRLYIGTTLSIESKAVKEIPDFLPDCTQVKLVAPKSQQTTSTPYKKRDSLSFPPNASSKHILMAALRYDPEEIAMAGLTGRVEKALMERNRRITVALKELSIYGIKHEDIVSLVEAKLRGTN